MTLRYVVAFIVPALSLALIAGLALLFVLPEPSGMKAPRRARAGEEPASGD